MATITTSARSQTSAQARSRARLRGRLTRGATYLALSALGFFYMYPILWIVAGSFKSRGEFFASKLSLIPNELLWQNYIDAWTKAKFSIYFTNTVFIAVMVVIFVNLFTALSGYAIARTAFPGKRLLLGAILVTMFIPGGYTIIPVFEVIQFLRLNNTLWAVILVSVAGGMIVNTFLYMGYFNTLPKELEDAARIDGANMPRTFWSVMFPLARPMTATVTLLTFLGAWNEFFLPLVFTLAKPNLRTLAIGVYAFVGENTRDWPAMCAATIITILPIILVFLFLQRYFIEGVAGAVK
jgi:raffinose/stachyose/melibiose transport system permease protein